MHLRRRLVFLAGSSIDHLLNLLLLRQGELCVKDRRQSLDRFVSRVFGRLTEQTLWLADLFWELTLRDCGVSALD